MMKSNLHTHTVWCDGKNTTEEMVRSAIESGFNVLGFSGHSYTSFDESYCMSRENTEIYRQEIRRLADVYRDQIQVFCGIEQDLFADDPVTIRTAAKGTPASGKDFPDEAAAYDYAIGSVHAVFKECSRSQLEAIRSEGYPSGVILAEGASRCGVYYYVDWEKETLRWAINRLYDGDSLALAEDYFDSVAQFADDPACQIVGHFDLLTKFEEQVSENGNGVGVDGGLEPLFDTRHPRYQEAAGNAIFALTGANKIFEINTGAMAKGYRTDLYPGGRLLELILQAGGRITVNSDCHAAGKLDYGFAEAFDLARSIGFTEYWVLGPDGVWTAQAL
ncbi:MAG: PHP domain-containing protein [Anaerovoracaceae bacterium]